ncbi:MAG TPA: SDR family oxidoreductase [Phycisphaerales bacterium]|nr:SDR family oxidoreductase [Phycisphaerales bacterium]
MTLPRTHHRPLALITGGARRIGRATTLALARAGCDVVVTYNTSAAEAEATLAEALRLGANPAESRTLQLRLDDPATADAVGDDLARTLPRLDVLVHNASTYERTPLAAVSPRVALAAFNTNALAPLLLSKHLSPLLGASEAFCGGSIVAMCDIHALGEHGIPRSKDYLPYAMSKAALAEMVRSLARELAPRVRVNAVAPGVAMWPESGSEAEKAAQQAYLSKVPLGRAGTPEECADVVRWLALEATYLTGEIVRFDGGRNLV